MNDKRKKLKCKIYPINSLDDYKFTVICSNYKGKWVLSKHKKRDTWETQGGHIENGESAYDCASRELFEESGITDAMLYPICDYCGYDDEGSANGVVFAAVVDSIGTLPDSEIKSIGLFDIIPEDLTYPLTTPMLIKEAESFLLFLPEKKETSL